MGLAGCAGTGSRTETNPTPVVTGAPVAGQTKPEALYIYDFSLDLSKLPAAGDRAVLVQYRNDLRRAVSAKLLDFLNREKIPAFSYGKDLPLPAGNFWLLDGHFTRVDADSHALGLYEGKNSGRSVADAVVQVADLNRQPPMRILIFETSGAAAAEDISEQNSQAALDREASRMAREITAFFVDYYHKQGWL